MNAWTIAAIGFSVLEFYLGKTSRVKSNSTLDLVLNGTKIALGVILGRRK